MKLSEKQSVSYSKAAFAMSSASKHGKSVDVKCGHCNSADLHSMFGKAHTFDQCPVKGLSFRSDARAAKSDIIATVVTSYGHVDMAIPRLT